MIRDAEPATRLKGPQAVSLSAVETQLEDGATAAADGGTLWIAARLR